MTVPGRVAISRAEAANYPWHPPFHPDTLYPEYAFGPAALGPTNNVYRAVRRGFELLGLDAAHSGTPAWNPLGDVVHPGDRVVVKPNFVLHQHHDGGPYEPVVT